MRELASSGCPVLAYEDGASEWGLGTRCEVFLAGAGHLLDSAAPDFPEAFGDAAKKILAVESEKRAQQESLKALFLQLGIVGKSPTILALFRTVVRVSRLSDLTTLLMGETGTGKELLARAIHVLDPKRSRGPFVAVNCTALPPALAESELFGSRAGAFTGAIRDRRGLFRAAQGGVLFLDEVGDLDPSLQGKLLRVLQEGRVLGLGEEIEVPVDVRVIAATNRDLKARVHDGRFRRDLYYRLNALSLYIPPLRERPEDLMPLVEHFLSSYSHLSLGQVQGVAPEVMEALARLDLPGNARELENVVRQALLRKEEDGPLQLDDLPPEIWESLARTGSPGKPQRDLSPGQEPPPMAWGASETKQALEQGGGSLVRSLRQFERAMLVRALELTHGNQTHTAHLLGITPRSVYNKLRKHGLLH